MAKTQAYQASQFEGFPELSVELDSFTAVAVRDNFHLTWKTGIEKNHAGFRLWRAIKDNKNEYAVTLLKKERHFYINECTRGRLVTANEEGASSLISAVGSSRKGACYSCTDTSRIKDGTHYYVLEDIDTNGKSTFHCDAIAAATRGTELAINLEPVKAYCRIVTGSSI